MRNGKRAVLLFAGSIAAAVWMAAAPVENGIHVETAVVQAGELVRSVWLNGVVRYVDEQPYVSMKNGKVSGVYVKQGDDISEGKLLFQLDAASETQALSEIYEAQYQNRKRLSALNAAAAALNQQAENEWKQLETQLKFSVEKGQVRAAGSGIMDSVYVEEGELVSEGTLLGISRGQEKQVVASMRITESPSLKVGASAWLKTETGRSPAAVSQIQPTAEQDVYVICIAPEKPEMLETLSAGETIQAEVMTDRKSSEALMPLEAAAADGDVWIIADGKVDKKPFEWQTCSRTHAQADQEWAGCTVILFPDQYKLKEGMTVRVKE